MIFTTQPIQKSEYQKILDMPNAFRPDWKKKVCFQFAINSAYSNFYWRVLKKKKVPQPINPVFKHQICLSVTCGNTAFFFLGLGIYDLFSCCFVCFNLLAATKLEVIIYVCAETGVLGFVACPVKMKIDMVFIRWKVSYDIGI